MATCWEGATSSCLPFPTKLDSRSLCSSYPACLSSNPPHMMLLACSSSMSSLHCTRHIHDLIYRYFAHHPHHHHDPSVIHRQF